MIQLAKEHSTKVVVLLNTNNPVEIDELKNDDEIGAILWAGEPGANGFLGVAMLFPVRLIHPVISLILMQ